MAPVGQARNPRVISIQMRVGAPVKWHHVLEKMNVYHRIVRNRNRITHDKFATLHMVV